mmetsp:Transcript_32589/g.48587  ORF Transcript_32589/g.48587 Transcript_32589/m.48587 type:complete len:89 (-) Transcript_32589:974-1240(-)
MKYGIRIIDIQTGIDFSKKQVCSKMHESCASFFLGVSLDDILNFRGSKAIVFMYKFAILRNDLKVLKHEGKLTLNFLSKTFNTEFPGC